MRSSLPRLPGDLICPLPLSSSCKTTLTGRQDVAIVPRLLGRLLSWPKGWPVSRRSSRRCRRKCCECNSRCSSLWLLHRNKFKPQRSLRILLHPMQPMYNNHPPQMYHSTQRQHPPLYINHRCPFRTQYQPRLTATAANLLISSL